MIVFIEVFNDFYASVLQIIIVLDKLLEVITTHHFSIFVTLPAATSLFKLLLKYRPEDKAAKKERLLKRAQAETEGKTVEAKKPIVVKYGLNHVTYLIEQVANLSLRASY